MDVWAAQALEDGVAQDEGGGLKRCAGMLGRGRDGGM